MSNEAYLIHSKGDLEDVQVLKFASREHADAYSFEIKEPRSAYVVCSDLDFIKLQFSGSRLVKLYSAFGQLAGTTDEKPVGKFQDLNIARQRVMMRLIDYAKALPVTEPPAAEKEWHDKKREGDIRAASEMYLGAADDFTRKEAERKLAKLGVPVPSQEKVEEHTMVAKAKKSTKKATKKTGAKKAPGKVGELTCPLPANLSPPEGTKSGTYIRSLIMKGLSTDDILTHVHKHFKGSTAKPSDVSWNRARLRDGGKTPPEPPKAEKKAAKKK